MFFKKEGYIVSDIGGTKTVIALINPKDNSIEHKEYFQNDSIKHYTDTLVHFINSKECKDYRITKGCFAVSGPINANRTEAKLTNRDWTINKDNILVRTPIHHVTIINDFEAVGLGINLLGESDYTELTEFGRNKDGNIAVIGAGTGLGISILPYNPEDRIPMQSEGGHVDLPITVSDKTDLKLQEYLIKKGKYLDSEDIVSGRGIINLYEFLLSQKAKHNPKITNLIRKLPEHERGEYITKYALEDKDAICIRTVELFIKYYARIARNLVLTTFATELIIAGGIAPQIVPALEDAFIEEFVNHKREQMKKILDKTTILVLKDPVNISLKGAIKALKL
jgi:glucokinase